MIRGCRSQLCFLSLPSFSTRGVISSSSLLTDARFIRITSLLPLFLRVLSLTFGTSHTLLALITLSVPAVSYLTDIHTLTIGRRRLFTIHTLVVGSVSLSLFSPALLVLNCFISVSRRSSLPHRLVSCLYHHCRLPTSYHRYHLPRSVMLYPVCLVWVFLDRLCHFWPRISDFHVGELAWRLSVPP